MKLTSTMTTILTMSALAAALMIGGCQSGNDKHGGNDSGDEAVEVRIAMTDVPATVREGFQREFPQARVDEVKKETYPSGTVHYEFEFADKDGKKMEVEFDEDGERLPDH